MSARAERAGMPAATAEERIASHYRASRGLALLWFGFLGGALAWKLQLMANYILVPYACWHDLSITIHLASLLFLLIAFASAFAAWRSWKDTGSYPLEDDRYDEEAAPPVGRSRWMAMAGLIMNPFFALVILGQWIPNLILSPCFGIS